MSFDRAAFTTRNLGFVTAAEQDRLRGSSVFVCGTGGMGGAAVLSLVRAGVGRLALADLDRFEASNLNRQVFCTLDVLGEPKAEATAAACRLVNPEAEVEALGADWTGRASELVARGDVVINGTDDLGASLLLYREARAAGRPVVDAYAAPLPSVYVTRAGEPMPEERLGFPTLGTPWDRVTDAQRRAAFLREAEHVLLHSSSRRWIDPALAAEVAAGTRPRMSWAPMVIATGTLMAYEALALLLGRRTATGPAGWFLNPYTARCERPRGAAAAALLRPVVRRALRRLTDGG